VDRPLLRPRRRLLTTKKVGLVVRVSDVKGRDKAGDKFVSPELQIAGAAGYAAGRGFEVAVIEPYDLNVSHTTPLDERPAMSRALMLVESGKLAGIVVSSQDRLGPLDITRELKERLLAAKAVLLVPDNPAIEVLAAKGYAKLPGEQMALMHEAQREEIGIRWHKARQLVVEYGIHPSAFVPVGYRRNEKQPNVSGRTERAKLTAEERWADPVKRQLVPNEHAATIRSLFRLRAAGGSWLECCKLLDAAGVPNAKGGVWLHSSVQAIIRNPAYKGWAFLRSRGRQGEDIVNPEAHEPIVDGLLWKAAQPKKGKPQRSSDRTLLSSVLRCASCGRKLSPTASRSHRYYRCRPRMVHGPVCTAPASVNATEIEALVTRDFLSAVAYRPAAPTPPDLEPFEQTVALAKAKEADWNEAVVSGEYEPKIALQGYAAAKERREAAEDTLRTAREAAGLDDERLTLPERWDQMGVEERRRTMLRFGATVLVKRGKEPVADRVSLTFNTDDYRKAATSDDFQPDVVVEAEVAA